MLVGTLVLLGVTEFHPMAPILYRKYADLKTASTDLSDTHVISWEDFLLYFAAEAQKPGKKHINNLGFFL